MNSQTKCPMDRVIEFSEAEMCKLKRFAAWRNDPKLEKAVTNYRYGDHDDRELHLMGLMAEYAVARYAFEPFDLFIDLHGDNHSADLHLGRYSAQVRCTRYHPPYLKFNTLEDFKDDIAILATPESETSVRLHGWVKQEHFKKHATIRNFGHGDRFCVGVESLSSMPWLKVILYDDLKKGLAS